MRPLVVTRWIALALVGLAVAAAVSLAASRLVSERIGLTAEPVSAGKELAPPDRRQAATGKSAKHDGHAASTTTTLATTTTTVAPTTTAPTTTAPSTTVPPPATTTAPPAGSGGDGEAPDD